MTDHRSSGGDLHRLLDEAFAGIEVTPEIQDLKEEIRGNLLARECLVEQSVDLHPVHESHVGRLPDRDAREPGWPRSSRESMIPRVTTQARTLSR